jgi:hypothetical protein
MNRAVCSLISMIAAFGVAAACAQGTTQNGFDLGDEAGVNPDASSGDAARVTLREGGSSSSGDPGEQEEDDSGTTKPKDDSGTAACTGKIVINELQQDGTNGAEFVELYNPTGCSVALGGWKLMYRSSENNPGVGSQHTFDPGDSIPAKGFLLFGNNKFTSTKDGEISGGLGNSGGQVGLVDDTNKVIDAVGYNSGTTGMYTEGSPAGMAGSGESIARKQDGMDTNNNNSDFKKGTPTPRAPN